MRFEFSRDKAFFVIRSAVERLYNCSDHDLIVRGLCERTLAFRLGYHMQRVIINDDFFTDKPLSLDSEYNKKFDNEKCVFEVCVYCGAENCYVKTNLQDQIGRYRIAATKKPNMYPDLLLHERDSCDNDALAIEIKRRGHSKGRIKDAGKLTYLTCPRSPYKYAYGFFLDLDRDRCLYDLYYDGDRIEQSALLYERLLPVN